MRNQFTPYGWPEPGPEYLAPTSVLDFEDVSVVRFAREAVAGATTERSRAGRLFHAVRDRIPMAVVLAACAQRAGIPSAIELADVINHVSTPKVREAMGGREVFLDHGRAALYVGGRWVKAVPAFNAELCSLLRVPPTEFDGTQDAVLRQFKEDGSAYMRYRRDQGVWSDLPFGRIQGDFEGYYPSEMWSGAFDRGAFGHE